MSLFQDNAIKVTWVSILGLVWIWVFYRLFYLILAYLPYWSMNTIFWQAIRKGILIQKFNFKY